MKAIQKIASFAYLLLIATTIQAQSYLEFVENKGQWDKNISYQGLLNSGAFALKPDGGYRMLLHSTTDLNAIQQRYHGGALGKVNNKKENDNTISSKSTVSDITLHSHAYEVSFFNANQNPKPIPDKPSDSYNNYFIDNNPTNWSSNCKIFSAVTYQNIYDGIDVRYYSGNGLLKYDFIVHPGADPEKIILYFVGTDGLKLKKGDLTIQTSVGSVKEVAPYAYQTAMEGKKTVNCSFQLEGSFLHFKLNNYDPNKVLIIDPQLVFSTFSGSASDNWGYTATYDKNGNFYAGGIVFSNGFRRNQPNGAFQTNFNGGTNTGEGFGFDMGIMKFDKNGTTRTYATYLGGSNGNEQPHSLVADGSGNLIIAGRTTSSNYPTTYSLSGSGGGWDIVITKLSADGTSLIGSRRIGGSNDDGVNIRSKDVKPEGTETIRRNYGDDARSEVILDSNENIYLASCTQSTDFPVSSNAFQKNNGGNTNGRAQDGVLIKTSPNLSSIGFSSYLGGSADDAAFVLAIDPASKNIYVAGASASTNFPGDKTNVINSSYLGGDCDGFVSIVSNDGSTLIKTSFFGTSGADIIYGIQFDRNNYPYIMGTTTGNWPIIKANNNSPFFYQSGGKQFVAKLSKDLSAWQYSTVFGSTNSVAPNISPTAFLVDRCEHVYVSGWGGGLEQKYSNVGTKGLSVTSDALLNSTDGGDFYFIVLDINAQSQLYGSFFGQKDITGQTTPDHVDGGTSRFDKNGVIYQAICANCGGGTTFPTTPGAWSQSNNALGNVYQCNLAAIKIAFNLSGFSAGIKAGLKGVPGNNYGCVPLYVNFKDTIGDGKKYIWNYGDGSTPDITKSNSASHVFSQVGVYKITMIAIDSNTCNVADTSYDLVRVRNDSAAISLKVSKVDTCTLLNYLFDNTASVAPAGKPFSNHSFIIYFGDGASQVIGSEVVKHHYNSPGYYKAQLLLNDTNYCNAPQIITRDLRIASFVKAVINTPSYGCVPYTAYLEDIGSGGQQFYWDFGDNTVDSTTATPFHLYTDTNTYRIRLIVLDSFTCNKVDTTYTTISVKPKPQAGFSFMPNPPQVNVPTTFTNESIGAISYKWLFGDGETLETTDYLLPIVHEYNYSDNFKACIISKNQYGCFDTSCQYIPIVINPLFDVPTGFSPNGDGINDKIYVRGFGISKMNWSIYNRWGTLVFQSSNKHDGWDGTYRGQIQPQEVYHYFLELEMSNGKRITHNGDITLLR